MAKSQLIAVLWTKQGQRKRWQAHSHQDLHTFSFRITGFVLHRRRHLTFSFTWSAIGASVRWLINCLGKPSLHICLGFFKGKEPLVKMLPYERCLPLVQVETSLVKSRFNFCSQAPRQYFYQRFIIWGAARREPTDNPGFQTEVER